MKIEMGTMALGVKEPVVVEEITFDTVGGEIHLHFNLRPEKRQIRFDSEFEDLPVGGI